MNKKLLYEKIMRNVSKQLKHALNEGLTKNRLNSDHMKSYYSAKYNRNTNTDSWGEPFSIGSYILGIFINIDYSNAKLMVGCVKEIKNGKVIAVLGNGDIGILNLEAGYKKLSEEMLHDLFAYDRLAPINRRKK